MSERPPDTPPTFEATNQRLHEAIAAAVGLDVGRFDRPGTVVVPEEPRTGSGLVVAYRLRQSTCLRIDPNLTEQVQALEDPARSLSFDEFTGWASDSGWRVLDGGHTHVLDAAELVDRPVPEGATVMAFDRAVDADVATITELIEASDPDDVDDAEIELDDLDPMIVGLVDGQGRMGSYASGRWWDGDQLFDDIGVLTRTDVRGRGWGSAAVAAFCRASLDAGRLPLYRCNRSNTGSRALALSVGFRESFSLLAVTPNPA